MGELKQTAALRNLTQGKVNLNEGSGSAVSSVWLWHMEIKSLR